MKGILHQTDKGWVVKYKMEDDLIATDGGMISLHPEYEKYYFLDWDAEGGEVEFEIEDFWESGLEEVIKVAKLVKNSSKINLEKISEEQLEQERNPAYKYFDIDEPSSNISKEKQKELLTQIMEEDEKDGLYQFESYNDLCLTASSLSSINPVPNSFTFQLDNKPVIIVDETGFNYRGVQIEDEGEIYKAFMDYFQEVKNPIREISDEEIDAFAMGYYNEDGGSHYVKIGIEWYKEQLKKK